MNTRSLLRLLLLVMLGVIFYQPAAAADASQRLRAILENMQTFRASFSQSIAAGSKEAQVNEGTAYLARPQRFRWEYNKPFPQLMVGDGKNIWIYDPELRQVTTRRQTKTLGNTPVALLAGNLIVSDAFTVSDDGEKEGLQWFTAIPRQNDANFSSIKLAFLGNTLARLILLDSFSQTTDIRFSNVKINDSLAPKLFQFTPPAGVDILNTEE